jgi:hypothetical protein
MEALLTDLRRTRRSSSEPQRRGRLSRYLLPFAIALTTAGCATLEDCGGALGNKTDARIRSSSMRMLLADPADAYARFAPYAAMSALVYEEAIDCLHELPPVQNKDFFLSVLKRNGWSPVDSISDRHHQPVLPKCDDDIGTFFRVWKKEHDDHVEVVIVFRGTKGGLQDWITGNLRWITRLLPGDDQYVRSREYIGNVLDHFKVGAGRPPNGKPVRFYSAGHSLGGGLAQNVLYRYPNDFEQAYAFDPSPVTGFADNGSILRRVACNCQSSVLTGEARVYRIYETDETLAWLRLPLKLVLPLNRHIQEVRFAFGAGHSMSDLAKGMIDGAGERTLALRGKWWKGRGESTGKSCTAVFDERLNVSCAKTNDGDICPR